MDLGTSHNPFVRMVQNFRREVTDAQNPVPKVLIGFLTILAISFLFPHGETIEYNSSTRTVWTDRDLIAPFSFPIYKDQRQYEAEKEAVTKTVYPVFERKEGMAKQVADSLRAVINLLYEAGQTRNAWIQGQSRDDSLAFARVSKLLPFELTEAEWNLVSRWQSNEARRVDQPFMKLERTIAGFLSDYLQQGIADWQTVGQYRDTLALRKGSIEEIQSSRNVYDLRDVIARLNARFTTAFGDGEITSLAMKIVLTTLQPNLIFNAGETNRLVQIAQDNVPLTLGYVQENERIVSKHSRITEEVRLKLDSFQRAKADREIGSNEWQHWAGILLQVGVIVALFSIYLYLFRQKIYRDNSKLVLIALILLMEAGMAHLTLRLDLSQPIQYLIFVPAASMLLAIIFDSRVAFYGTATIALLVAGLRGNDYAILLASLAAGAFGAYTVRDIRNRTQIFRSLIFIFLGYFISILAISLSQFDSFETIMMELTFALANAVFSPVITYGLLIFFERAFRVTTDLTLLELSDFNQPLLRQLSEKAPGTFHHSMLLGNLSEAAAEAIEANPILARVGAYYHDIGKMLKPEYFIENQLGSHNKHNRLRPRMSALIIAAHVKEGIELGRKHGLPEKVIDFIPQHHGTTLISFFYDKAVRQATKRQSEEQIQETDYRYPGPKPQTREAAIVMLADSVEASTRAMDPISPPELEAAIEGMIKQRFMDGQLDESDLTLKDLARIKDAFFKILVGIHHQRIKYPEQERQEEKDKPAETVPSVSQQQDVREQVQDEIQNDGSDGQHNGATRSPEDPNSQLEYTNRSE